MAQLYRDIQLGTVWEGSGNVIALDVLRALEREPHSAEAFLAECELAAGADERYDAHLRSLRRRMLEAPAERAATEWGARRLVEDMALALQGSLLLRHSPDAVSSAFCAGRLDDRGLAFGDLPRSVDGPAILARALAI